MSHRLPYWSYQKLTEVIPKLGEAGADFCAMVLIFAVVTGAWKSAMAGKASSDKKTANTNRRAMSMGRQHDVDSV